MKARRYSSILRKVSLIFIGASLVLMFVQLVRYARIMNNFQPGLVIAGVPVGGLTHSDAEDRLTQAYSLPIELHYQNAVIQINPAAVGFSLDLSGMLAAADTHHIDQSFIPGFWAFLWGTSPKPEDVPLMAAISEDRLRNYIQNEIVSR